MLKHAQETETCSDAIRLSPRQKQGLSAASSLIQFSCQTLQRQNHGASLPKCRNWLSPKAWCNMKCEPSPGLLPAGRVRKLRLEKLNPQDFPTSVLHVQCVGDGWGWLGCTFFIHTRGRHSCSFAMLGIMQGDAAFEKVR